MAPLPYIHPDLTIKESPTKGRLVSTTSPVARGDILLFDGPNALVPAMLVDDPPFLICSRHGCHQRMPNGAKRMQSPPIGCMNRCLAEVVWCSTECRSLDTARHQLECFWLKKTARQICDAYGDSEFVLMWLIVRILIVRYTHEEQATTISNEADPVSEGEPAKQPSKWDGSHFSWRGWDAVWNLEGDPAFFSPGKVQHWRTMTNNYIRNGILPLKYDADDIVKLICKVETNSFGLYPGVTGQFPVNWSVDRGDYYGGGIYPTAAMFNHSCCPNITHELDDFGRRVFRAGRDIEAGEECCISYFDLTEFPSQSARREAILKSWNFICDCKRCEEDLEVPDHLRMMDLDF